METIRKATKGMNGATFITAYKQNPRRKRPEYIYFGKLSEARSANDPVLDMFCSSVNVVDKDNFGSKVAYIEVCNAAW